MRGLQAPRSLWGQWGFVPLNPITPVKGILFITMIIYHVTNSKVMNWVDLAPGKAWSHWIWKRSARPGDLGSKSLKNRPRNDQKQLWGYISSTSFSWLAVVFAICSLPLLFTTGLNPFKNHILLISHLRYCNFFQDFESWIDQKFVAIWIHSCKDY